ncbi:DnaA/Hda family protein [uncultured Succinivibrio sp.]|uniref:DnaA ATPase domain-containing protein n=1 Tax=uncultured Succinivibrio sp. TaxID=540749 RepID=UPI0025FA5941|nr:DnaA/Hda family protein [uncultured Succinivibrio sp.]
MDLEQVWHEAVHNCKQSINDPIKLAAYDVIELQASIKITGSDLCFICNNDFVKKLIFEYVPALFMEITRIIDNNNLGIKLLLSGEFQHSRMTENSNPSRNTDNINPDKTFENYVTDPKNAKIYEIAQKIAENPGDENYNPLFMYGSTGLGKTHLAMAIANRIKKSRPALSVLYLRAEEFIRLFVESMSKSASEDNQISFEDTLLQHDVLIIDDLQSLTKGEKSRDAFFKIIDNYLDEPGKQLIMTSSKPVGSFKNIPPRIISELGSGVCTEILPPSYENRVAITCQKCKEQKLKLDQPVVDYIAQKIRYNVRAIEGAVKTLKTQSEVTANRITYNDAVKLLSDLVESNSRYISIETIKEHVAEEYGVTVDSIESAAKNKNVSYARSMAMTLANDLIPNLSLNDIGIAFNKGHSYVHEAIKRTRERVCDERDELSAIYERLIHSLKNN